jgi:hypothetical protein
MSACRLTACGLPARVPAAYLPGAKNPPPYVSRLNIKHYQKIIGFKKLRPFSPKEKCIKIFLPLQFL